MGLTVKQRGAQVATFRYIQVALMETLAAWVPTTPEMEAKLLFGAHIWDVAQHADALGKRTFELRLPLQHSLPPVAAYLELLGQLAGITDTRQRIAAFYDMMLPALGARYLAYLDRTDTLMDAPTVRILERMVETDARMIRESRKLRDELSALQLADPESNTRLGSLEAAIVEIVADSAKKEPVAA